VQSFRQFSIRLDAPLQTGLANRKGHIVTKVKAILKNPYLLGAQGFLAGAFLLWSGPVLQQAEPPQPQAEVQLVPPVS
jgi:hypothetical protein